MSSASSAVTYTSVYTNSEPGRVFWGADEELSDGGSSRVIVYGYDGLSMLPVAPPSPDYILSPEEPQTLQAPQDKDEHEPMFILLHVLDFVPEPIYPEYIRLEDEHTLPTEEQPLPLVVSPTAESPGDDDDDGDSSGDDADDEDEEEEHLALAESAIVIPTDELVAPPKGTEPVIPPPSTDTITTGARITVRIQAAISFPPEAEVQQTERAELRETDHRHQAQMAKTLRVMGDMRREMGDIKAVKQQKKVDELFRNNHGHQQQTPKRKNVTRVYNMGTGERKLYSGNLHKCTECHFHHNGSCTQKCHKCNKVGHFARDCRSSGNANVANALRNNGANPKGNGCFECGATGHFKRDCPKLKNKDGEKVNAPGWVYAVGNAEKRGNASRDLDLNVVTGTFLLKNRYASILFDTGADRSFISTAFNSLIDIIPTLLGNSYDVELADGKIVG
nr:hypothetical protein [Tanacetum cinerariifolium]GEY13154.1 hypothetical protein [Tanacetum cinerariifolium]